MSKSARSGVNFHNIKKSTKLTHDILLGLGFKGEGRSRLGRPLFRLEWEKYHYQLQIELANYPSSNPNSGIVSVYYPEWKDMHVHSWQKKKDKNEKWDRNNKSKKIDFLVNQDGEHFYGVKYVTFPEKQIPIAWRVTTLERLNKIYTALTQKPPLQLRNKQNKKNK